MLYSECVTMAKKTPFNILCMPYILSFGSWRLTDHTCLNRPHDLYEAVKLSKRLLLIFQSSFQYGQQNSFYIDFY